MENQNSPLTPENWLRSLFSTKAVLHGGVIRREARDVERFVGMERFLAEVNRRGFRVIENSGQLIILCNQAPVRWLTDP